MTIAYNWGFQDVRKGEVTLMGPVTSFEQGCLDAHTGPGGAWRSYVKLTLTSRHGETLTVYAAGMFDFAVANAPSPAAPDGSRALWAPERPGR